MTYDDVMALPIEHVRQEEDWLGNPFFLFYMHGIEYELIMMTDHGILYPYLIFHLYLDETTPTCPYCNVRSVVVRDVKNNQCAILNASINYIFDRLITFNTVRLQWLYRSYNLKVLYELS